MAHSPVPSVIDGYLQLHDQAEGVSSFAVGSHAWYAWLENVYHTSFSFKNASGLFTARYERQRNGWYWYAYRKRVGKTYKVYLGKSAQLTLERLNQAALLLSQKSAVPTHTNTMAWSGSGNDSNNGSDSESALSDEAISGMSSSVVTRERYPAKFSIPSVGIMLVPRPRLLARLEAGAKGKLLLLSAPAGWGKTALLATWCTGLRERNVPFAWITLDSRDNDPRVFWLTLLSALHTVQPGSADAALALLQDASSVTDADLLQIVLDAFANVSREIVLFMDDYQYIEVPLIHQQLSHLLAVLPAHVHLVLAGREQPPLSIARLRVQGNLLELRAADLAFTQAEISTWLVEALTLPLSREACVFVEEYTEGWAAGLHLVALAMQNASEHRDPHTILAKSSRYMTEYLLEEVLFKQPPDIQEFLLHTSILEHLHAPLCDEIRGCSNSQAMLERLEQLNLLFMAGDQQTFSYRYHLRLAETLRSHLRQMYPALEAELQHRVSIWPGHPSSERVGSVALPRAEFAVASLHSRREYYQMQPLNSREQTQIMRDWYKMEPAAETPVEPLTERERDVLLHLVNGASNREIADTLVISEGTVKKHVSNICSKLSVQRRTQAITRALSLALL